MKQLAVNHMCLCTVICKFPIHIPQAGQKSAVGWWILRWTDKVSKYEPIQYICVYRWQAVQLVLSTASPTYQDHQVQPALKQSQRSRHQTSRMEPVVSPLLKNTSWKRGCKNKSTNTLQAPQTKVNRKGKGRRQERTMGCASCLIYVYRAHTERVPETLPQTLASPLNETLSPRLRPR